MPKASAAYSSSLDHFLQDMLPTPGVSQQPSLFDSGKTGLQNAAATPQGVPSLGRYGEEQAGNQGMPQDPVSLPSGVLAIKQDDAIVQSPGQSITWQRLYLSERKDQLGGFGQGWLFPYEHSLRMYAGFDMVEMRPDGSQIKYAFTPGDTSQYIDSFDGDSLIYYNLDQGTYTSDEPYGSKLQRISQDEYRLTDPTGNVYTFKGYYASWRQGADPGMGKLVSVEDKNGNKTRIDYDQSGAYPIYYG
ncbi:DUF6531 domain-containing protein [Paenibacillus alginolyticus]|uniref:DUF6531 domain-containing protein n=1 Tax=Paenibacillus alginolyticus TaxID=59839 RepID=UPI001378505C|nr:DUF6531 domain-containing protein [Paenibacillus alginolyticus]MCY9669505.1 DUF6531 domain-containing protein [Paenibacillus alginolyticus]